MKSAKELLGDFRSTLPFHGTFAWTDEEVELVAERAREEMLLACVNRFHAECRVFDNGSDAIPELTEECISDALRALPTHPHPALTGKERP